MAKNLWIKRFDANDEFVARRALINGDEIIAVGDAIDKTLFTTRRLRQMYDQRTIAEKTQWDIHVNGEGFAPVHVRKPATLVLPDFMQLPDVPVAPAVDVSDLSANTANIGTVDTPVITLPDDVTVIDFIEPVVTEPVVTEPVVEPVTEPVVTEPVVTEPEAVALPGLPGVAAAPVVEPTEDRESLIADAKELGIKVDGRWSDKRLKDEINAKLA